MTHPTEDHIGRFNEAMADENELIVLGLSLLRESLIRRKDDGSQQRACVVILTHAAELVEASWRDLSSGRLAAARNHRRSIEEAYEYAGACVMDRQFADRWLSQPHVNVTEARRRFRDQLEAHEAGAGTDFHSRHTARAKMVQDFSHVGVNPGGAAMLGQLIGYESDLWFELLRVEMAQLVQELADLLWAAIAGLKRSQVWVVRASTFCQLAPAAIQSTLDDSSRVMQEVQAALV